MRPPYVLAPEAAADLGQILDYLNQVGNSALADRVEAAILDRIEFLSRSPGVGHSRPDLTSAAVIFFPVYSYLGVYRPQFQPLQVVAILHGHRQIDVVLGARR